MAISKLIKLFKLYVIEKCENDSWHRSSLNFSSSRVATFQFSNASQIQANIFAPSFLLLVFFNLVFFERNIIHKYNKYNILIYIQDIS